ncbi:hypothetical protein [Bradyrhizobium genosp. P]|uniref:hypothetical protein n=1 Tax=Bradyrhizobium genosp. P TaxID=83641 RepID=UPI003CF61C5C
MRAPPSERCGALYRASPAAEATFNYADKNRKPCNISVQLLNQVEGYHREAVQARNNACASFRPLFKNDMRIQGLKLMTMLAMVVYNLPERDKVSPAIGDLAARHMEYGVKFADYDAVRECAALDPRTGAWRRSNARRP